MSMANLGAINVKTLKCSLEKEFMKLICMNHQMIFMLFEVDGCHSSMYSPLTLDVKDILWMDDSIDEISCSIGCQNHLM